ncbi:hypothetical protein [Thermococcus litoralis]|uniref:hypothetical protein n=1 Tax=Thermococcus litoralis TaxID=2265 RepID=UPI000B35704B|nr:hypothetical protein [Thermococcus litoralis]
MQSGRIVSNTKITAGVRWVNLGITAQIDYTGSRESPTKDPYATLEGVESALKSLRSKISAEEIAHPEVSNLMLEIKNLIESARATYELGYYDFIEAVALAALEAYRVLEEAIEGKRSK